MREEGAAPSQGLDLQGLIKQYGPALAAAAGVILARGTGGRDIGNLLRRLAPQHFEKLNKSKIPYFLEMDSQLDPSLGSRSVFTGMPMWPKGSKSGDNLVDTLSELARDRGHEAPYMGHINVANTDRALGAAVHEFGHAVGHNRAADKVKPGTSSHAVSALGQGHLDQIDNPKVQAMVKNAIQRSPYLKGYYATYMGEHHPAGHPYRAWGELTNEAWAELIQRKAGLTPMSIEGSMRRAGWDTPSIADETRRYQSYVDEAARSGKLPPGDHHKALTTLQELLQLHGRPPAPPSPVRPSSPASPARGASRPGSSPSSRPWSRS